MGIWGNPLWHCYDYRGKNDYAKTIPKRLLNAEMTVVKKGQEKWLRNGLKIVQRILNELPCTVSIQQPWTPILCGGRRQRECMDSITFKSDTVLSDVHVYTPNIRHLMVRLNAVGQPVFVSKFKILRNINAGSKGDFEHLSNEEVSADVDDALTGQIGCSNAAANEKKVDERKETAHTEILLDDDGDLHVTRRPTSILHAGEENLWREKVYPTIISKGEEFFCEDIEEDCSICNEIRIEHTMGTTLEDVGKQVWRGAFLLADYILNNSYLFRGYTVLELGAGTGMTSIVMATIAKTVYCTDVGVDLLNMCERNIIANKHIYGPAGSEIKVRELDWLRDELCTDTKSQYCWSEEEISQLYDHTDVLLAADVFYDDDLTDAFFQTVYRILSNLRNPSTIYFSVEKRLNFTLRKMDVTCDAYDHFRLCLADLENISDGKTKFVVEPVKLTFPQFLFYERVEQLELWKIIAEPLISNTQQ